MPISRINKKKKIIKNVETRLINRIRRNFLRPPEDNGNKNVSVNRYGILVFENTIFKHQGRSNVWNENESGLFFLSIILKKKKSSTIFGLF